MGEHGDLIEDGAVRVPITRDRISIHHYAIKRGIRGEDEEGQRYGSGQRLGLLGPS